MAKYFGVTPSLIAQSIGYSLLGIAVGPIFYNPLSRTIGRRPTYLLGSALFIPCVLWMALSKDYAVFCAARFFAGFFSAFSQTVPPASIADIYPPERRGDKMSLYGVACILSPAISPVIGGLVIEYQQKWQIIYWIVLGFAGLQLIMFIFLVPETLWVEDPVTVHEAPQELPLEDGKRTLNGQPIRGESRLSEDATEQALIVVVDMQRAKEDPPGCPGIVRPSLELSLGVRSPWYVSSCSVEGLKLILLFAGVQARFLVITLPSFYYGSLFAW
jgi:multidrug resistance protein